MKKSLPCIISAVIFSLTCVLGNAMADSNTVLLIHSNNQDGSNIFTDSSASNNSISPNGNVVHSTAQFKFGGSSIYFDGDKDYLSIPDSEDWNFISSDGTIDFWVNIQKAKLAGLLTQNNNDKNWAVYAYEDGRVAAGIIGVNKMESPPGVLVAGVWHHIAFVKSGNVTTIYVDGINVVSGTTGVWNSSSNPLRVGGFNYGGSDNYLEGYMDEIRVSKGVARWTSNFTPPTGPVESDMFVKSDMDDDGVIDEWDVCPDTPVNSPVDNRGCAIDCFSQDDIDAAVEAAIKPLQQEIGTLGEDSDGDGVIDSKDSCPDTPLGSIITQDGCPVVDTNPPTGAVKVSKPYIWQQYNQDVKVTISGYVRDELSCLIDGAGTGVSSAYISISGKINELALDGSGRFSIDIKFKAEKEMIYNIELFAADTKSASLGGPNKGLVDSVQIRVQKPEKYVDSDKTKGQKDEKCVDSHKTKDQKDKKSKKDTKNDRKVR